MSFVVSYKCVVKRISPVSYATNHRQFTIFISTLSQAKSKFMADNPFSPKFTGAIIYKKKLHSTLSVLRGHSVMPALYHQAIEEAVTEAISLDLL